MKNKMPHVIPQFGLYGEEQRSIDPDFVHIEDIAVRSSDNGWRINPHRHSKMFQILCMRMGKLDVTLDEEKYSLVGSWAITVPPGVVHGFQFMPGTEGVVLTIADPFLLNDNNYEKLQPYFDQLIDAPQTIELDLKDVLSDQLVQYLELIKLELETTGVGRTLMLKWLVKSVLMTLKRQHGFHQLQEISSQSPSLLLANFRALVEQFYREHWRVKQYAHELNVSVSTLNRICHSTLDVSARTIIHDRLMIEAKRRILYTQQTLDQIAGSLGFKDPAYFSRFFKKLKGVSPSEYRNSWEITNLNSG